MGVTFLQFHKFNFSQNVIAVSKFSFTQLFQHSSRNSPPSPGPDPGVAAPLTCCLLLILSGVGTPLRNFVMESWSSFLTEVYFFWRLAFLISLGLFFLGSLLSKICFSGSGFLTFFGPKFGLLVRASCVRYA